LKGGIKNPSRGKPPNLSESEEELIKFAVLLILVSYKVLELK
jgi:hypothetical protein